MRFFFVLFFFDTRLTLLFQNDSKKQSHQSKIKIQQRDIFQYMSGLYCFWQNHSGSKRTQGAPYLSITLPPLAHSLPIAGSTMPWLSLASISKLWYFRCPEITSATQALPLKLHSISCEGLIVALMIKMKPDSWTNHTNDLPPVPDGVLTLH